MRVLMVSPTGAGGIHQYAWELAVAAQAVGVDITLACPEGAETLAGPAPARLRLPGAAPGPRSWVGNARAVLPAAAGDFDLVHFQTPLYSPADALALLPFLRRRGVRSVGTVHEVLPNHPRPAHTTVYRRYWSGLDGVAVHSRVHSDQLHELGVRGPDIQVVPFGSHAGALGDPDLMMDPRKVLSIPADQRLVLFFGLIAPRKGLMDLIEALAGTGDRVCLLVAGEPQEPLEPYRLRAAALGVDLLLDDRFLGYLPGATAAACLASADLIVAPYRSGGNSGVLAVAAHLQKPVVATRATAPPEYLSLLPSEAVVPAASPSGLRQAVLRALEQGLAAPAPYPTWEDSAKAHLRLWSTVLRSAQRQDQSA